MKYAIAYKCGEHCGPRTYFVGVEALRGLGHPKDMIASATKDKRFLFGDLATAKAIAKSMLRGTTKYVVVRVKS